MVSPLKKSSTFRRIPFFSSSASSSASAIARPSPVHIPEILEKILSHVSQHQLLHTTRLVCRLWNATSQSVMVHPLCWCDTVNLPEQQRLLSKLGQINVLKIVVPRIQGAHPYFQDQAWNNLQEACRVLEKQRRQFLTHAASSATVYNTATPSKAVAAETTAQHQRPPMAILELHVGPTPNLLRRLLPILPSIGSTLRVIRIENLLRESYQLDQILRHCPLLVALHVEPAPGFIPFASQELSRLSAVTIRTGTDNGAIMTVVEQEPLPLLKLQVLVLTHMTVLEVLLKPILEKCPDLRELKATGLQKQRPDTIIPLPAAGATGAALGPQGNPGTTPIVASLSTALGQGEIGDEGDLTADDLGNNAPVSREFLRRLAQWCPRLESIQLSHPDSTLSSSDIRLLLRLFPQVHSLGFSTRDIVPAVMSQLRMKNDDASPPPPPRSIHPLQGRPHAAQYLAPIITSIIPHTLVLNTITLLEIYPSQSPFNEAVLNQVLHDFLCDAPNLLHLKAEHVQFYIEYFDIVPRRSEPQDGILTGDPQDDAGYESDGERGLPVATPAPITATAAAGSTTTISHTVPILADSTERQWPRVWACRKLQTLHLSFKSLPSSSSSSATTSSSTSSFTLVSTFPFNKRSSSSPEQSRAIFGYLSRACPSLRVVTLAKSRLNLTLEGGFCLLTRMKDLEKLTLQIRKPPRPPSIKNSNQQVTGGEGSISGSPSSASSSSSGLFKERDFCWLARHPTPWQIVKWSLQGPIITSESNGNSSHGSGNNIHCYNHGGATASQGRKAGKKKTSAFQDPPSPSRRGPPRRKSDGDSLGAVRKWVQRSEQAAKATTGPLLLTTTTAKSSTSEESSVLLEEGEEAEEEGEERLEVPIAGPPSIGFKILRRTQSWRHPLDPLSPLSPLETNTSGPLSPSPSPPTLLPPKHDDNNANPFFHETPTPPEYQAVNTPESLPLIQYLGLEKDIKAVLRERALDHRVGCWSKLEKLTVYYVESWDSDLGSLERIIRRLRPEVQFSNTTMPGQ
ncbi:hypothetical protein EMPS_06781 [Entomortierella parvispora]|uniref:F-box domain-containing protein n=1 Tax=Entomortierella parvispora TaxID=205924 RepID=A0A9P3LXS9_9FUNG|nr:hypothetical protein EMPS_06781 [Entomortierella parvispora]